MDILSPPPLSLLYEAPTAAALLQVLDDLAKGILGGAMVCECSLLLLDEEMGGAGCLLNAALLAKRRHFRLYRLSGEMLRLLDEPAPVIFRSAPVGLFSLEEHQISPVSTTAVETVAIPLPGDERRLGALLIGLSAMSRPLEPTVAESLLQVAVAAGRMAPRLLQFERIESQNQQIQCLHEGLLKTMLAADKNSLLSSLLAIMTRQFGFARVLIGQVHADTQVLRSELHSGFKASFAPFSIPLENTQNFFIRAMNRGEVQIHEALQGPLPEELPSFILDYPAERRVLLPLKVGTRQVGLIYADQPLNDGTPVFKNVLEIFARMAAAALENIALRLRAEQRAETDALTGLYNRYFLDKVLEIEIPRVKRYNHPISLLMIDLCDFKRVNDTYGHQFGDYILRETANLIEANVRRPDVVARYGGDEFVVLMVNTSLEQARLVRDRIENAFIERNRLQSDERMTIKISLGLRSADATTIEGLLHEADMAMYAHKARQTRGRLIEALITGQPEKIEQADRVVGSLCNILYKKAPYYAEHARRMAHMALKIARRLGLSAEELESLVLAALLHDVGKVSIPTEILQKVEPLTAGEIEAMRHHPELGQEFFQGLEHLEPIRPLIYSHHERYDGQMTGEFPGYPEGLCGDRIPLGARILKLAESADCMLSGRPYRAGMSPETVTRILREEAGHSFDPLLVNILLADKDWYENLSDAEQINELLNFAA